jgi:molecular chaperone DnaK (HSP70)
MLLESFEHAQEDVDARMLIEARNEAETVLTATEKAFRHPDFEEIRAVRLTPDEVARVLASAAALREAIGTADRAAIQDRTAALNDATKHLAEVMMNWTVQAALAGRSADDVAAQGR